MSNQKEVFDLVRGALSSIEFYSECYSSGEPTAKHKADLASMLRMSGENKYPSYSAFLSSIADAIEKV